MGLKLVRLRYVLERLHAVSQNPVLVRHGCLFCHVMPRVFRHLQDPPRFVIDNLTLLVWPTCTDYSFSWSTQGLAQGKRERRILLGKWQ
jgi:hypothetical protein